MGNILFHKTLQDAKNVFPLLKFSLSIGNICQLDECTVMKTEGPSHFLSLFQSDPSVLAGSWLGHTDAVWGLAYSGIKNRLLSCSADGTVKLWNPTEKNPCISTFNTNHGKKKKKGALPAGGSLSRLADVYICQQSMGSPHQWTSMVVTLLTWWHPLIAETWLCMTWKLLSKHWCSKDRETAVRAQTTMNRYEVCDGFLRTVNSVILFSPSSALSGSNHINKVVSHPTLPVTITAHEDRHIKFFDNKSGQSAATPQLCPSLQTW